MTFSVRFSDESIAVFRPQKNAHQPPCLESSPPHTPLSFKSCWLNTWAVTPSVIPTSSSALEGQTHCSAPWGLPAVFQQMRNTAFCSGFTPWPASELAMVVQGSALQGSDWERSVLTAGERTVAELTPCETSPSTRSSSWWSHAWSEQEESLRTLSCRS